MVWVGHFPTAQRAGNFDKTKLDLDFASSDKVKIVQLYS